MQTSGRQNDWSLLSTRDQLEVDQLNDDIRRLKQDNKKAFAERMRLEAQKNKLGRGFIFKGTVA
jgi:structural maintenance of chromosome 3 (chondroitin sulfate proteoglycan 6)